ncbi:MAG: hypothetical protein WCC94_08290 [Candidatus Bathyarchaeia archaeon]
MVSQLHPHLTARQVSAIAIFAAIQAVVTIIPFSIAIGVSGSITLGVVTAPLIGLLLGPLTGGFSVLVGALIGLFLNPAGAIFGILTPLPAALGALAAGFIRKGRGYVPAMIILLCVGAFYLHPFGRAAMFYPWLNVVAMILAFSPVADLAANYFASNGLKKITFAVAIAGFVGTMTDHTFGSALAIWYYNLPTDIWNLVMYIYPVERIITVAIVTVVGTAVYYRLKLSGMLDAS